MLSWSGDGTIRLWDSRLDAPEGKALREWKHEMWVWRAMFDRAESHIIAWSRDGYVCLWSLRNGNPIRKWKHAWQVRGAQLSGDESRLLTWSEDCSARFWDTSHEVPARIWQHDSYVTGAVFSRDESRILTWCLEEAQLSDPEQDLPIRTWNHGSHVTRAVLSEDQARLRTSGGRSGVRLRDLSLDESVDIEDWRLDLEVRTATTMDDAGHVHRLGFEEWKKKSEERDR